MAHMSKTIYVGMSGGVDSSVSAALLKQQGYLVVGVYMKNWTQDIAGVACPWRQDLADAKAAAAAIDIPLKVFDFQTEYKQQVVDAMVAEYQAGRTPNPDVLCNQEIKFQLFLQAALADGADAIATGHYAQTKQGRLLRAADANKDQTYFLYRVSQAALEHSLFPLGGFTKPQVRRLAEEFGLPNAKKPDSQGICFVGEVGVKDFLRQYIATQAGPVVEQATGQVIGRHDGAIFYTIGQRHGLGIGGGRPLYVVSKDLATNTVYVTTDPADLQLHASRFILENPSWIVGRPPAANQAYQFRLRHRGDLIAGQMRPMADGRLAVQLDHAERAVAAGQSAVVYDGQIVLGGGIIAAA